MILALCVLIVLACALLIVLATGAAGFVLSILDDIPQHPEKYQ